jgi:TRAP-type mannitol/chloroaromatic compound transport system permease small subunit
MRRLIAISNALARFVSIVGHIGAWAAMPLMLVTIFDVVGRRFFQVGSTELQEWEWHFHTILFTTSFGLAYIHNAHVRVDLLREKWPPRRKAWMELIGNLVFLLPYLALLLYYSWTFVSMSYVQNEGSAAFTGLGQRWIIKSSLLLMVVLMALACMAVILRKIVFLFGPRQLDYELFTMQRPRDEKGGPA